MAKIQPNKFGKYKKEDVEKAGFKIFEVEKIEVERIIEDETDEKTGEFSELEYPTATDLRKDYGINLTPEQRLEHCIGFVCQSKWYGCVPVFDISHIMQLKLEGKL